jgi:transposase-like protein
MRPDRAVVKKAIQDAEGNLSRAAALLGCTRQTLYTWIYQLGLERLAGVRMDSRDGLDKHRRPDRRHASTNQTGGSGVQSSASSRSILRAVEATNTAEPIIPATIKIRESLWKRLKIRAIEDGTTMGTIVDDALERVLSPQKKKESK